MLAQVTLVGLFLDVAVPNVAGQCLLRGPHHRALRTFVPLNVHGPVVLHELLGRKQLIAVRAGNLANCNEETECEMTRRLFQTVKSLRW